MDKQHRGGAGELESAMRAERYTPSHSDVHLKLEPVRRSYAECKGWAEGACAVNLGQWLSCVEYGNFRSRH